MPTFFGVASMGAIPILGTACPEAKQMTKLVSPTALVCREHALRPSDKPDWDVCTVSLYGKRETRNINGGQKVG